MSWDIALAKKLKRQAAHATGTGTSCAGIVQSIAPLVVSIYDGELMLRGDKLRIADTITDIRVGDTVCVVGSGPYTVVARWR
ncbi:MAG: hypothetical protein Q4P20_09920 [Eubacteriales bacterium]|nr:hypothetical protein [Eubacteriales bacterium]